MRVLLVEDDVRIARDLRETQAVAAPQVARLQQQGALLGTHGLDLGQDLPHQFGHPGRGQPDLLVRREEKITVPVATPQRARSTSSTGHERSTSSAASARKTRCRSAPGSE